MPKPLLVKIDQAHHGGRKNRGIGPMPTGRLPMPATVYRIDGVTRDSAGAILGSCVVKLFRTSDDTLAGTTTSDATTGAYLFYAALGRTYYVVAYKAGSPDLAGTTVNTTVVTI